MRRTLLLIVTIAFAANLNAGDREKALRWNVALQPLFTIGSAAVQGKLRTWDDWKRCLRVGATSGAAFYGSKALVGRGRVVEGLLLANAASSMSSNAAAGRHPLSRLGVTIGPMRVEFSTPKETERSARVYLGISAIELGALYRMWNESDSVEFRDGLVAFRKNSRYDSFDGRAYGVFPGTAPTADEGVWRHEVIHVIQAMQLDSVEPPICSWRRRCRPATGEQRFLKLEPLQAGLFHGAHALASDQFDYIDRWNEIEAYRLAQEIEPIPPRP